MDEITIERLQRMNGDTFRAEAARLGVKLEGLRRNDALDAVYNAQLRERQAEFEHEWLADNPDMVVNANTAIPVDQLEESADKPQDEESARADKPGLIERIADAVRSDDNNQDFTDETPRKKRK